MPDGPLVDRVRIYRDAAGEWRWSAFAGNNEKVADSGEGYEHQTHAHDMADDLFPEARIEVDDGRDGADGAS